MDVSFALGSFAALVAAWTFCARRRPHVRTPGIAAAERGEPGFLRRIAS